MDTGEVDAPIHRSAHRIARPKSAKGVIFAGLAVVGLVAAAIVMLAAIAIARIAIPDEALLVGALGFSGILSLLITITCLIGFGESLVWWRGLAIAGLFGMPLFAVILLGLMSRVTLGEWWLRDVPTTARKRVPGLRTIVILLVVAIILIVIDLETGARGWGVISAIYLTIIGALQASSSPFYRYYLGQRMADIKDFEPDLLDSLNRGPVSRHVLRAIQRWTANEG